MFSRTLWIGIIFLIVSFGVIAVIYTYPKQYALKLEGVLYQLGEHNRDAVKPVTVRIDGEVRKKLNGTKTFKGTIDISGENIPVPEIYRELNLSLGKQDGSLIIYSYIENEQPQHFPYGHIFANDDFSKITITKFAGEDGGAANGGSKGWNGKDGFMISAPARSKDEALSISNELMKVYLQGYTLK